MADCSAATHQLERERKKKRERAPNTLCRTVERRGGTKVYYLKKICQKVVDAFMRTDKQRNSAEARKDE